MGSVHALPLAARSAPNLLDELLNGVADGYNRLVAIGRFDKAATRVMMGYLCAGSVALRCNGLDSEAEVFLQAAHAIERDWTRFCRIVRKLYTDLGRPD